MIRPTFAGLLGLAIALPLTAGAVGTAQDKPAHDQHAAAFLDCAKVCNDCQRQCDSCARHCALLVAEGKKDHLETLGTCTDCADICATAARIVSRQGPFSAGICEGCARACDACGAACDKFKDDAHMKACADSCRKCAQACRDMVKHTGQAAPK
jgi:hypothetical protein